MRDTGIRMSSPPGVASSGTEISAFRPLPSRFPPVPSVIGHQSAGTSVSRSLLLRPVNQLLGDPDISLGAYRSHVIQDDRLAKARGFSQPHISGNHGFKNLSSEVLAGFGRHLARQIQPGVVHRQKNAIDAEPRIGAPLYEVDCIEQL